MRRDRPGTRTLRRRRRRTERTAEHRRVARGRRAPSTRATRSRSSRVVARLCRAIPSFRPEYSSCPRASYSSVCPDVSTPNRLASAPSSSRTTVTPGMRVALLPRAGLLPAAAGAARFDEDHERPRLDLDAREQLGELAEAGTRAVAARMREHHQRRRRGIARQRALRRPARRRIGASRRACCRTPSARTALSGRSQPQDESGHPDQRRRQRPKRAPRRSSARLR